MWVISMNCFVSFSQSLHQLMGFLHFRIYLRALNAISLNFGEATYVSSDDQVEGILFLGIFKKIVKNYDLFDHLAVWVVALGNMGLHLLDYSLTLLLYQVHVLLLVDLVLLSFHLVFYLLHCVGRKGSEFLLDLSLDVFVVLENLMLLAVVFFLLVHLSVFLGFNKLQSKEIDSKILKNGVFYVQAISIEQLLSFRFSIVYILLRNNWVIKFDSKSLLQLFFLHLMLKIRSIRLQISV